MGEIIMGIILVLTLPTICFACGCICCVPLIYFAKIKPMLNDLLEPLEVMPLPLSWLHNE